MSRIRGGPFVLTNRLVNPVLTTLLGSRAGVVLGRRLAVVSYAGRRTGRPYAVVAGYQVDGAVVRLRAGAPERKTWWRNFQGGHPVRLRLAGRDYAGQAQVERRGADVRVTAEVQPCSPLLPLARLPLLPSTA